MIRTVTKLRPGLVTITSTASIRMRSPTVAAPRRPTLQPYGAHGPRRCGTTANVSMRKNSVKMAISATPLQNDDIVCRLIVESLSRGHWLASEIPGGEERDVNYGARCRQYGRGLSLYSFPRFIGARGGGPGHSKSRARRGGEVGI